jgi:hypothetical protein
LPSGPTRRLAVLNWSSERIDAWFAEGDRRAGKVGVRDEDLASVGMAPGEDGLDDEPKVNGHALQEGKPPWMSDALWRSFPQVTAQPPDLRIISLASLAGKDVPVREWLVPEVIPANQVTILSGNGGDGKSLLALQLGIATVTGTGWIKWIPEPGGVLYASAEDEPDEVHRRIADIVAGRSDLRLEDMGNFNVIDLSAMDALLAKPEGKLGVPNKNPYSMFVCSNNIRT